jgi:dihydrofolate synthase/folylpolyglutamate synthase
VVHVAGTNGKGSVSAMAHAILAQAGCRVGLYTSPHLISFTERIRIGGEMISEAEVVALTDEIHAAATMHGIELTFFEFTTVMAFLHFARCQVEIAVVEVGLGGRLDATNVVDAEVAVITSIGMEHEEYLGDTLASVAGEKAGIIKTERPLVIGCLPPTARVVVEQTALAHSAPVRALGSDFDLHSCDAGELVFRGLGREIKAIRLGLEGSFQRDNAALAIAAVTTLSAQGEADGRVALPVSDDHVRAGLATAVWPGRLEIVAQRPQVILDCAHNPQAIAALVAEVARLAGSGRTHLLFAVMRDKRWQGMVRSLAPMMASCTVSAVQPPRGESAERVAAEFRLYGGRVEVVDDPEIAIAGLVERTSPDDTILVTGSLFLIGAVYPYFMRQFRLNSPFDRASLDTSRP